MLIQTPQWFDITFLSMRTTTFSFHSNFKNKSKNQGPWLHEHCHVASSHWSTPHCYLSSNKPFSHPPEFNLKNLSKRISPRCVSRVNTTPLKNTMEAPIWVVCILITFFLPNGMKVQLMWENIICLGLMDDTAFLCLWVQFGRHSDGIQGRENRIGQHTRCPHADRVQTTIAWGTMMQSVFTCSIAKFLHSILKTLSTYSINRYVQ